VSPVCIGDTSTVAAAAPGAQDKSVVVVRQGEATDGEAFDIRGGLDRLAHLIAPGVRQQELSHVRLRLQPPAGEIAVDIAAGTGFLTLAVASWTDARMYAVGSSDFQLIALRSRVGGSDNGCRNSTTASTKS
jgi:ubiquinone/menaquinone biosynthesis C-methylase UbiE